MDSKPVAKKKKFKPRKVPRLLPGSVDRVQLYKDLATYNQHLYNMHTAVTKTDTRPPPFQPLKYLKMIRITEGAQRLREIDQQNKELLKKINLINRNQGHVDTFNPLATVALSNWRLKELELRRISKENHIMYGRLLNTKSQYPKKDHDNFFREMTRKMEYFQRYPHYRITTKDDELRAQPSISHGLEKPSSPCRQRCFLEFQVPECRTNLGRVYIELYTEYAPKTAEHFLARCRERNGFAGCPVDKIYKDKYLLMTESDRPARGTREAEQEEEAGGTLSRGPAEWQEETQLRHSRAGVLSVCPGQKLRRQYCLTFSEMPELDGRHTVFGKVVKGADTLYKVNDFGRKFGKPIMKLVVFNCGGVNKQRRVL